MPTEVLMPSLSPTMTKGKLSKWAKKSGDVVKSGDVIAEIETDKAIVEFESVDDGRLFILVEAGENYINVNSHIANLFEEDEYYNFIKQEKHTRQDVSSEIKHSNSNNQFRLQKLEKKKSVEDDSSVLNYSDYQKNFEKLNDDKDINCANRVFISPVAKRMSKNLNLDISKIQGSGPRGRIVKEDIINLSDSLKEPVVLQNDKPINELELLDPTQMQKAIASRLSYSKREIPHFYLKCDIIMDSLLSLRKELNLFSVVKISINDFIVKAVGNSIAKFDQINCSWQDNKIKFNDSVDVSIAVGIDQGLVTPIVKNVEKKKILDIVSDIRDLIGKAKLKKLLPHEYEGGSVTISNLGMYGVEEFSAIINPPQSVIVAVGAVNRKIIVDENLEKKIVNNMRITVSCDHRVINGILAAQWLRYIKDLIENPLKLLL